MSIYDICSGLLNVALVISLLVVGYRLLQHRTALERSERSAESWRLCWQDLLALKHAQDEADRYHDLHQAEARDHENTKKELADLKAQLNRRSEKC